MSAAVRCVRLAPLLALLVGCAQIVGAEFDDLSLASGGSGGTGGSGAATGTGGDPGPPSVTILDATDGGQGFGDELKGSLDARGEFGDVTVVTLETAGAMPPPVGDLLGRDAVVFIGRTPIGKEVALRNLLQAYVDQGGKLVIGRHSMCTTITNFTLDATYAVMIAGPLSGGSIITPASTSDPLLEGAEDLTEQEHCAATLAQGAVLAGAWSNGDPLVASRTVNGRLRVDINAHPDTPEGAALYANALLSKP